MTSARVTARWRVIVIAAMLSAFAVAAIVMLFAMAAEPAPAVAAPAAVARPANELTRGEIDARQELVSEERHDPHSTGTAQALARLALAQGHAGHLPEAQETYTRLLQLSRWIDPKDLPGIDLPADLARHFEKARNVEAADAMWGHAYESRRRILGRKHPLTVLALRGLATRHYDAGRPLQAEPLLRELDALAGEFTFFPREEGPLAQGGTILRELADVYRQLEMPRERAAVLARLFAAQDAGVWPSDLNSREAIELALVFHDTGARKTAVDILERSTNGGSGEGAVLVRKIALAWLSGRLAEAMALERELFARNPFGPASPIPASVPRASGLAPELMFAETLDALCELGSFYRGVVRLDQAARLMAEMGQFTAAAPQLTSTAIPMLTSLALAYRRAMHWEDAERCHVELLELLRKAAKPDERQITYAMARLATVYLRLDRKVEAVALQREVIERVTKERGEHDWFSLFLRRRLGEFHASQGDLIAAERVTSELLRHSVSVRGPECEMTADAMEQLALIHWRQKKVLEAERVLMALLPIEKRRLGPEHPGTLFVQRLLGDIRREQGRFAEACALHRRVLDDLVRVHGIGHRDAADAFRALAEDYVAQKDFNRAAKIYLEATRQIPTSFRAWNSLAWFRATAADAAARDGAAALAAAEKACELSAWAEAACLGTLAAAYAQMGTFDRAVEYQRQAIAQAELDEHERHEWTSRLALYLEQKPYRQPVHGSAETEKN